MNLCDFSPASEDFADFIVRYPARSPWQMPDQKDRRCFNYVSRDFAIFHLPLEQALPLTLSRYSYENIPKLYGLQDTTALEVSGISPVFEQPALNAAGRGVLIGFIDTGIDYTNPLFRNADGTTRIYNIWDQSVSGESAPEPVPGFQPLYGTVYSQAQINQALSSEEPYKIVPSRDTDGHGTFMAGVAAGNQISLPEPFSGAAPESSLAVVKLKPAKQYLRDFFLIRPDIPAYQENDIMAAVSYLLGLASQYQMPLVIYLGTGTSQGAHDGTSPLSLQLQDLIGTQGFFLSAGAGNEAGYHHHYFGGISENQDFDDVEIRVGSGEAGFCLEMWAKNPELYTVGFVSPSGEIVERIPLVLGNDTVIPFRLDSSRISLSYLPNETNSGSQLIFMRFETPAQGIWHIRVYPVLSIHGQFHMWLPMHGFVSEETIFLRPDPDTTITDPGNSLMPATVSTFNHSNNSIYIHSSRGYTRDGQIKPDLAAPGVRVQGPAIQTEKNAETKAPVLTWRTGSSVAAAITAGAAAVLLSWGITAGNDKTLTSTSLKAILIRGADRNPGFSWPNRQWGFGMLNLYQSFLQMRE